MKIIINDKPQEVEPQTSVADLLESLGLTDKPVAVEVNRNLVTKSQHPSHQLAEDDQVEIVTLVGGG